MTSEQEYCVKCRECCKWVCTQITTPSSVDAEFYLKRGCRILRYEDGVSKYLLYVPSVCPNLKDDGCSIYPVRPVACSEYRGNDPITLDVCQWGKVRDGEQG